MADGGAVASCNVDSEEGAVAGSGAPVFEETYMRFKWDMNTHILSTSHLLEHV